MILLMKVYFFYLYLINCISTNDTERFLHKMNDADCNADISYFVVKRENRKTKPLYFTNNL